MREASRRQDNESQHKHAMLSPSYPAGAFLAQGREQKASFLVSLRPRDPGGLSCPPDLTAGESTYLSGPMCSVRQCRWTKAPICKPWRSRQDMQFLLWLMTLWISNSALTRIALAIRQHMSISDWKASRCCMLLSDQQFGIHVYLL